ncbi:hypothetical protein [Streptomyces sp. PT12]|uniref:hypothetical protein n=1 Tax=Streptomyces sp. PT12 TaxID=1510197 RepID=UPI0011BDE12C|nr:hypothetical protein [Streptomyces sp. PT12]
MVQGLAALAEHHGERLLRAVGAPPVDASLSTLASSTLASSTLASNVTTPALRPRYTRPIPPAPA